MYENITYAELKSHPKEQKPDAWKELKSLFKTQKELAGKLGMSPATVYSLISRYVKDKSAENESVVKLEAVEKPKRPGTRLKSKISGNRTRLHLKWNL